MGAGCVSDASSVEPAWLDSPLSPFPSTLSATGAYASIADTTVADRAFPYTPRYPLYSDGLAKQRFVVVPEGQRIELGEDDWSIPAGTVFFKTFGEPDGRPIETRLLRRTEDGFDYAVYLWRPDGEDADRLPLDAPTPVEVSTPRGTFQHHVPDEFQCRMCHESNVRPVIGFTVDQLSAEAGRLLDAASDEGLLEGDPVPVPRIDREDEALTRVLTYSAGNCVHCHNGLSGSSRAFDLRRNVFVENTVNVSTTGSGIPIGLRIAPGSPEDSILFQMVATRGEDPEPMPPVGRARPDPFAVDALRAYISNLPVDSVEDAP